MQLFFKLLEKSIENLEVVLISSVFLALAWRFHFSRREYSYAALSLGFGLFAIGFYSGILAWLSGLGGDSFLEANEFNVEEALFWVATFFTSLIDFLAGPKTMALVSLESLFISVILYQLFLWKPKLLWLAVVLLAGGHLFIFYKGYVGFEAGRSYVKTLESQFEYPPKGFQASEDIDLLVYIGESTTSLNMSLYGYPLDTTPKLDTLLKNDPGFVRFDNVRSTHTHTSGSLLRALAVTSPIEGGGISQWGIGNVLRSAGLTPQLLSVQPLNGSFAAFSKFIFEGGNLQLTNEDRYKGNLATPRVKDHVLLESALRKSGVIFFHSYAGHGRYLNFIEPSLSHLVAKPPIRFDGILGTLLPEFMSPNVLQEISDYDQAMTYIDRNVSQAVEDIRNRRKPAVLIYFSDHGEAVFTNRGHESSKFIEEMSTVPMVMYFNEAYQSKYPDVFQRYHVMTKNGRTKILDQVSTTILDVLRIRSVLPLDVPTLASTTRHPRPYFLERDTVSGPSRIDLEYNTEAGFSKAKFFGGTPDPTYISVISEKFAKDNMICYHRADSYAKALRAAVVANCLEFDLMVEGGDLNVYHPPATATGFRIDHIFSIAQARKNSLWIDSKNLSEPEACNKLASYLEGNHERVGQILVEFPWEASSRVSDLQSCGRKLRAIGVRTSYYVPTHFLLPCAENPTKNESSCKELDDNVQKAMASEIFSDLSFDFLGYSAMKRLKGAEKFKWNTWAIKAQDFHRFPHQDFSFVIMDTSTDPNTY